MKKQENAFRVLTEEPHTFENVSNVQLLTMVRVREFRLEQNIAVIRALRPFGHFPAVQDLIKRAGDSIAQLQLDLHDMMDARDVRLHEKRLDHKAALNDVSVEMLSAWVRHVSLKELINDLPEYENAVERLDRLSMRISGIRSIIHELVPDANLDRIGDLAAVDNELMEAHQKLLVVEREIARRQNANTTEFDIIPEEESPAGPDYI